MNQNAKIRLLNNFANISFDWFDFDGDDCFNDFQIIVAEGQETKQFNFGRCAIFGLRKLSNFFLDKSQETVGLGFRNPDIRYCDIFRLGSDYRLVVRFEGNNLFEEINLKQPDIQINHDSFELL